MTMTVQETEFEYNDEVAFVHGCRQGGIGIGDSTSGACGDICPQYAGVHRLL